MSQPWHDEATGSHPGFSAPFTKEAWREYVGYTAIEPPELPPLDVYQALSADEREDLDELRFDYHSALVIVETPAMVEVHSTMRTTLRLNAKAPAGARRGHVIDGAPTLGKSTIVKTFGRDYELGLRRRHPDWFNAPHSDFTPVVYVSLPAKATPRELSLRFAHYLGLPVRTRATSTEVTDAVLTALRECGTRLVFIDDIHYLDCSHKDGKVANDHLKYLANYCSATFVYAGVEVAASGLFAEGGSKRKTQTAGRFTILPVKPFGEQLLLKSVPKTEAAREARSQQRDEWVSLVWSMESALRLYRHVPGTLARDWEYLLDRTGGSIATLGALVRLGAIRAIEDGSEAVTRDLLERTRVDAIAETGHESRKPRRKNRGVNKVTVPASTEAAS